MASVSFNLRDKKTLDKTSIYCFLRFEGKKVRIRTGLKIFPYQWDFKKQRCNNRMNKPLAMEMNITMNKIEEDVLVTFLKYQNTYNQTPEPHEIKRMIEEKRFGKKQEKKIPTSFFGYWDHYINNQKRATSHKTGKLISMGTIQTYINAKEKLKEFEQKSNRKITFDRIDLEFYYSFIEFLESKGLSKNTIGKQIKILKGFLNDATSNDVNTNLKFRSNKFNVLKEETTEIYLNLDELQLMIELDLSEHPHLHVAHCLFLILCFTGQRYQSLRDILDPENRDAKFIRIKQAKGDKRVVIPILPQIKPYIKKLRPRDVLDNGRMNKQIKEVGSLIPELQVEVKDEITKGGKKRAKNKKKYELIGTHTGRRSFATNFYNSGKIPIGQIMAITGHKKESTFFSYIRTAPEEHAQQFLDALGNED